MREQAETSETKNELTGENLDARPPEVTVEAVVRVAANLIAICTSRGGVSSRVASGRKLKENLIGLSATDAKRLPLPLDALEQLDDFDLDHIARQAVRLIRACHKAFVQWEGVSIAERRCAFDEGLNRAFPSEGSQPKREQLHRKFWRYALRHDHAIRLGKTQIDDDIPCPSESEVTKRVEDDRSNGFSEQMVEDMKQWRKIDIPHDKKIAGKRGGDQNVRRHGQYREKGKFKKS